MRKRAAMRLISGALAAVMAVSSLGILDALFGMRASAVEGSESISALAPDEYDNKTKTSDPVTLLVGTENHLGSGTTLDEVWRDYENTYLLGVAADFCIFLQGNFKVYDADAEGRVAIGGDFYIDNENNSYAIGTGDYVTLYDLDRLLPDMVGSATIVLGGRIFDGQISDVYYENGVKYEGPGNGENPKHKSSKILVINDESVTKEIISTWTCAKGLTIPEKSPEDISNPAWTKLSWSQTYIKKIIDFDYYYNEFLPQRSADLADEVADLKPTSPTYSDGYAKEEYEDFTVEYSNGTITFTYKHPEEATEVVHFKLSDEMFEYYRIARNVNYVGIPHLPEARDVLTTTAETIAWEYSYIVVDVEADGKGNEENRLYIADNGSGNEVSKVTRINGTNISKDDGGSGNNDHGVTSLLYNFYNADEDTVIVLGGNFQGTILAPKSHVTDCKTLNNGGGDLGHLSGALIARSFEGYTEFGYRPFSGPAVMVGVSGYGIVVDKTDGDNSNALLAGATISVYKAVEVEIDGKKYYVRGAEVASGVSSDEASLILGGLTEGKYILCETEAPDGYAITNKEIYFEITGEDINKDIVVGTGTTSPQAIVYTVVDNPTEPNEISREDVEKGGYVAAEEVKYYEFGNGADQISQLFINTWNGIQITVNSVTIEYENGDIKKVDVNKTTTGYEPDNWINILTNSDFDNNNLSKTGIKKFTVNAKWVNPQWDQTSTEVQFGWQNGSWQTVYSINLHVGTEDTEIQIGDEIGPPTQYYKIASDGETSVVVNGQDVVATPGTEYAITKTFKAKKGTLTVYSDNAFTDAGKTYTVNPLDIEKNVYEIGGKKYTFKLDGDDFKLYDENGEKVTDPAIINGIKLYHPDDAESWERVVIFEGNIIYPNDMIFNDGKDQAFKIVNFKSKSSVTGEKVDAADTNNKLAGATFSVYEAVLSSDGTTYEKGDKVDTVTSGADGSFVFDDLPAGKYILCEDTAPEGYKKTEDVIYFEITSGEPSERKIILWQDSTKSAIVYTVVDDDKANLDDHTITREQANSGEYVAAKEPEYYRFAKDDGSAIGQVYVNASGVYIESVTLHYDTISSKTYDINQSYPGWTLFLQVNDWDWTTDDGHKVSAVTDGYRTGISKITIKAKVESGGSTEVKFGWQNGNWEGGGEYTFTLTNEISEITLLDSVPTEYYRIVGESEKPNVALDDGTIVEAEEIISYITRKFVVQNDVLTVYSDNTFGEDKVKSTTAANALDIENNVYVINGAKYTVELDDNGDFKVVDKDGNEYAGEDLKILPVVDGGYVLILNGEIVAPESMFGSVGEFTIKNYKTTDGPEEEKIEVKIEKVWEDFNNACGSRPDKITVTVTGTVDGVDAKIEQTVELTKDNWSTTIYFSSKVTAVTVENGVYTFPMYDANGNKYNYTYTEATVAGYEGKVDVTYDAEGNAKVTITNTLNELGDLEVDKTWSDSNGFLGAIVHPKATFTLTALDGKISKELTLDSNGKLTFENLPLYTYSTDGDGNVIKTPIVYTLTETVTGYIGSTTDGTPVEGTTSWTFTLTDVTDFTEKVTKKIALQNDYEKTAIEITKVWVDNNAVDNRPDEIEVTVTGTANGKTVYTEKIEIKPDSAGDWKCTLSNLPKYYFYEETQDDDSVVVKSVPIEYKVDETLVSGYTPKVEGDAENGFTITNTRTFGVPTDATTEYGWMLPLSMLLAIGTVFFAIRRAMQRALRPPKPYLRR